MLVPSTRKRRASTPLVRTAIKRRRTTPGSRASAGVDVLYTVLRPASIVTTWTGSVTSLFANIARADNGVNSFAGSTIFPKSIKARFQLDSVSNPDSVRIIIFQTTKGATPTAATLLDQVANVATPISSYNRGWKSTGNVLSDKIYVLMGTTAIQRVIDVVYIKGKKLRPVQVVPTTTAITSGDINVYIYSGVTAAGATVLLDIETTYTD